MDESVRFSVGFGVPVEVKGCLWRRALRARERRKLSVVDLTPLRISASISVSRSPPSIQPGFAPYP